MEPQVHRYKQGVQQVKVKDEEHRKEAKIKKV